MTLTGIPKGFTLIELMIVLVISGMMLSIIGPLGFKQVASFQAHAELLKVENIVNSAKVYAFNRSSALNLSFDGKQLVVFENNVVVKQTYIFEKIFFEKTSVQINKHGYSSSKLINVQLGERIATTISI